MSTARIELENVNGNWIGEVEIGGMQARRERISAATFDDAIGAVRAAYRKWVPAEKKTLTLPGKGQRTAA